MVFNKTWESQFVPLPISNECKWDIPDMAWNKISMASILYVYCVFPKIRSWTVAKHNSKAMYLNWLSASCGQTQKDWKSWDNVQNVFTYYIAVVLVCF